MTKNTGMIVEVESYHQPGSRAGCLFSHLKFQLTGGNIAALFGASGVGKSTLLKILLGIAPGRFDGRIWFCHAGNHITPVQAKKNGVVGVLFDDATLVPWLSVNDNLMLPASLNSAIDKPSRDNKLRLLHLLALDEDVLSKLPHELSFGTRHRIAVVRALVYSPDFLMLDELFTGLDVANILRIRSAIREYVSSSGAVCLMISHDIENSLVIADEAFHLASSGKLEPISKPLVAENVVRKIEADVMAKV